MRPAKSIWFILTIKCDRASSLASQSLDRRLSWTERCALRAHELCCHHCRRFHRQLIRLREAVRRHPQAFHPSEGELSQEARSRVTAALQRQLDREWDG